MGIQHGPLRLALLGRTNVPGGTLQPRPCSDCRNSDRKPRRRLSRRLPALDRRNNALTQIHAVRLAHPILPNRSQRWNQHSASKRILSDSLFEEFALAPVYRAGTLTPHSAVHTLMVAKRLNFFSKLEH